MKQWIAPKTLAEMDLVPKAHKGRHDEVTVASRITDGDGMNRQGKERNGME